LAAEALFSGPYGVSADGNGNLFIADTYNQAIREISNTGVVTTLASGGNAFNYPEALVVDGSGDVFVANTDDNTILKVTSAGVVTTFAGSSGVSGASDGTGSGALFYQPVGIAIDGGGNLYVADETNDTIRKISSAGVVTTIAGTARTPGSTDGAGSAATFNGPQGIAVDSGGNVYVADTGNNTIRKITSSGTVSTIAGSAGSAGSADGASVAARFRSPTGLSLDASGNLYVADTGNSVIRLVTSAGMISTLAGEPEVTGSSDGIGSAAMFQQPFGVAIDGNGNLYVADTANDTIRLGRLAQPSLPVISSQPQGASIDQGGSATLSVSATGVPLPSFQWQLNSADISGAVNSTLTITNAQLSDGGTYTVVVTNGSGSVTSSPATLTVTLPLDYASTTFSSLGSYFTMNGFAAGPSGVALDPAGNVFVSFENAVAKLSPSGGVLLVAGGASPGSADGSGSSASFDSPAGIALDSAGNIYVADSGNNSIRKVTPAGMVTTIAGLVQGGADGVGVAAQFDNPTAVAVDKSGNIYVADTGNGALREVSPSGSTSTLLVTSNLDLETGPLVGGQSFPPSYSINGVAVDANGTPYVGVAVSVPFGDGDFPGNYVFILKVTGPNSYVEVSSTHDYASALSPAPDDGSLAIDGSGNVYELVGNSLLLGGNVISGFQNGSSFPSANNVPSALAVGSAGKVYVANPPTQSVIVITPLGSVPNIAAQPEGSTIAFGASTTLSVSASATPAPTYQWQVDGVSIPGATSSSYSTSTPGTYTVQITNAAGTVTSSPAVITAENRLANISSRALVGTQGNVEIAGFVVAGPPGTTEQVLVRAVGPTLAQYGVSGVLALPQLTLFDSKGNGLASNTGWNSAPNAAQIAAAISSTGAFALPLDSGDSAILISLPPGAYTAQISGLNTTTGVALAEVYEVNAGDPELINISTRAYVGTGSGVEIGGFIVKGAQPAKVLVRAIGPTLSQFGVNEVLAKPSLSVMDASGNTVATNTGWSTNPNQAAIVPEMAAVGAFALPLTSADCVLLLTLPPGSYTAIVSGAGSTTGVALVEVYQAP
jgi:sugar lactone lactonase YvrE